MAISVPGVPGNLRVPFIRFGIDNSQAGFFTPESRLLIIGQKLPSGTATADTPVAVFNDEDDLFGVGSMLANMVKAARRNSGFSEIWGLPVDDNGAGVKATKTITVTGAPSASIGIATVFIGGRGYTVQVLTTDSNDDIAAKLQAEIAGDNEAYVAATVATNVVTLEAKHAGELGNDIDVRDTYLGQGSNVSGITLTIADGVVGAANPNLSNAIAALGDEEFDWWAQPYSDATNVGLVSDELNDAQGRWWAMRAVYGHALTAKTDTVANLSAYGNTLNDQHLTTMGIYKSPSVIWEITSAIAAKAAFHLTTAPELSRPLQTIALEGVLAPEPEDRFTAQERNALYFDGVGAFNVTREGTVRIDRMLTTYQTNANGDPDSSYLDIQVLAQLQYLIRYFRFRITQTYPRHSLKGDDEKRLPGQFVARPKDIKATMIAAARELANQNVIEGVDIFAQLIIVQISDQDPNCVEMVISPDLVNQWRLGKTLVQFYNQYPSTDNADTF